jgi:hypothetical protein
MWPYLELSSLKEIKLKGVHYQVGTWFNMTDKQEGNILRMCVLREKTM